MCWEWFATFRPFVCALINMAFESSSFVEKFQSKRGKIIDITERGIQREKPYLLQKNKPQVCLRFTQCG